MLSIALQSSSPAGASVGAATPGFRYHWQNQSAIHSPSVQQTEHCGENTMRSNGLNGRSLSGQNRKNTSHRDGKQENKDWLAAHISRRSVQEVVDSTGMTDKAVQNMRRGKSKISFDNLVDLCRDDPEFAAAFAEHVGLILPGQAEFAGAITKAFNAYQRRGK